MQFLHMSFMLRMPEGQTLYRPDHVFWHNIIFEYLSHYLTNLTHKICFTISFISSLYMFRAHVLIVRRSQLHYTASGIITPIGGRLVYSV